MLHTPNHSCLSDHQSPGLNCLYICFCVPLLLLHVSCLHFCFVSYRVVLCVAKTGGVLFEYYELLNAPNSVAAQVRKILMSEDLQANEDLRLSLVPNYALRFWYDAIRVMRGVNRKCNKPLALWTMLMEYRGLSRTGRMLASAVHGSLPISTYDKYKSKTQRTPQTGFDKLTDEFSS